MNKRAIKRAALLAAACMLPVCFSSCGKEESVDANAPVKISWVATVTDPDNAEMVQFVEEKFNVDMDIINIASQDALMVRLASGDIPDVMNLYGSYNMEKYQKQNLLAEIPADLLKEHAPTLLKIYEQDYPYDPPVMDYCKIGGKIYALPSIEYSAKFHIPLAYRGDWMEKLGVEKTPETLEEFEALMYRFANEDPDGNGKKDTYGLSSSSMNAVYGAFGYQLGNYGSLADTWRVEDGKMVFGPVQPKMKEALAYLQKWYADGVLDPEYITGENTGGNINISHAFLNGKIGATSQGAYYYYRPSFGEGIAPGPARLEMSRVNQALSDNLRFGQPPVGPYGDRGLFQWNMYNGSHGLGKQVEADKTKLTRILDIAEFGVSSQENWQTMHYGIEGKHWDKSPVTGEPVMHDGVKYEDIGAGATFLITIPPSYREQTISEAYRAWTYDNQFDKNGITNDLMITLPSEQKYSVELKKLQEEAYFQIITGLKPLDFFDEFVQNWYAGGGEQLVKEANEWYTSLK